MYTATAAFISAVTKNSCGMVSPAASRPVAASEATTMNTALRMLLAATMRATCERSARDWISAYSGTEYSPAERASSARSATIRQAPGAARNCASVPLAIGAKAAEARNRSMANTVMPIEPSGTRPISTRRRDSFSQASEPAPMPSENTASRKVTTPSPPPRTSRAYGVKLVRKIEPKNHSQEMPTIELNTATLLWAIFRLAQVSVSGFQLISRPGSAAGECGTNCAAMRPSTATTSTTAATARAPRSPNSPISRPPPIVPSRMATKVPISTSPLPPVSSCASRCCGK